MNSNRLIPVLSARLKIGLVNKLEPYVDTRTPAEKEQDRRIQIVNSVVYAFKDDDPDTMMRRIEALDNYILNGSNEVN